MAVRYAGRHVRQARQARHGAWVNTKRSHHPRPPAQLLPAVAALIVAGFLVGGATTAIALSPASSETGMPAYDPADVPPPDPRAGQDTPLGTAARAPLTSDGVAGGGSPAVIETGSCEVSYYPGGGITASGEAFDATEPTAAHRTLPFGSLVRVTNDANGESVVVRINDRGPYYGDRCLDLSVGAFAAIADPATGVADVRYEVLAQDAT